MQKKLGDKHFEDLLLSLARLAMWQILTENYEFAYELRKVNRRLKKQKASAIGVRETLFIG